MLLTSLGSTQYTKYLFPKKKRNSKYLVQLQDPKLPLQNQCHALVEHGAQLLWIRQHREHNRVYQMCAVSPVEWHVQVQRCRNWRKKYHSI